MCKSFFTIALICSLSPPAMAQTDAEEGRTVVEPLFDGEDRWKIIQITDTRRTGGCEPPVGR